MRACYDLYPQQRPLLSPSLKTTGHISIKQSLTSSYPSLPPSSSPYPEQSSTGSYVACLCDHPISALCLHLILQNRTKGNTYAAACSPSQSSSPVHISPADNAAQISSSPRSSRRSARSRCSCHRHIVFGSRRPRLGLCWLCRARRVLTGVRLWRRWRGWGGGHHWIRRISASMPRTRVSGMRRQSLGLETHTTICFLPRRALRMNLRVRSVTGCSRSAMLSN